MKVYTKHEVKMNDGTKTGSVIWFMHDFKTNESLSIKNFDSLCPTLPYAIEGTAKDNCFMRGNVVIDELEFQEAYDRVLESLQNYMP